MLSALVTGEFAGRCGETGSGPTYIIQTQEMGLIPFRPRPLGNDSSKKYKIVVRAICKPTLSGIAKCNAMKNTYLILIRQFLHCLP
jgi:hypothetical protein